MGKIIKLDKNLANQIAAGEVVERPVSIVKELVENSIDAGSESIKVEIVGGGIEKIIVTDDGAGIEKEDLALVFDKYTTSKISSLEDLYNIMTFGFRGEALSSISSVTKLQLISKTKNSDFGYSLKVVGGEKEKITSYPSEKGTKIIIEDLFFNTPARLNYLKKHRTEYSHILEFLNQISLSYPKVGIEFISDNKQVFKYPKGDDLKTRIYNIYSQDFYNNLLDIDFSFGGVNIKGYISDPKVSFSNKNRQVLFINNRIVKSPIIYKAISNAYNRYIPHNSFPAYVINIILDPTEIDVNVHPRKLEVRFANESQIFKSVYSSINNKLENVSLINSKNNEIDDFKSIQREEASFDTYVDTSKSNNDLNIKKYYTGSGTKFKDYSPYKNVEPNPSQSIISNAMNFSEKILGEKEEVINNSNPKLETSSDLRDTPLGKIIGQTFNSYIIVETKNSLKILDQHALAERIIYEKLIKNDTKASSQKLLFGESFNLTAKELDILKNNNDTFNEMGFDYEILSGGIVMLNGIPDFVKKEDIKNIFIGILEDVGEYKFSSSKTLEEIKNKIFAYTSCRSAIKFGNKLNLFEMNKLLHDSVLDYSATCPHGRPVVFEISLDELKDKYER
ncbi:hypothetical protein CSA08_01650 [Candidatus Gracilibacteria bacterium]|nr:MAG: hypothetical protein CSA08_01650 [Candidatus Gracilibacteria bacterium]